MRKGPPASHPCSCGEKLEPVMESEPFTMHTVIGRPIQSWLAYYYCPRCHLMYSVAARAGTEEGGE